MEVKLIKCFMCSVVVGYQRCELKKCMRRVDLRR